MGSRMTPRTDNRSENEARRKLDLYLATEHGWHGEAPVRIFIDESRDLLDEALAAARRNVVEQVRPYLRRVMDTVYSDDAPLDSPSYSALHLRAVEAAREGMVRLDSIATGTEEERP